jgi:competence protein ComEC
MKYFIPTLVFTIATFSATIIRKDDFHQNQFIIWNIGQGQWATLVEQRFCQHYDMGGEKPPSFDQLISLCGQKKNVLYLSHWDWDHMSFIGRAQKILPALCLQIPPRGTPQGKGRLQKHKRRILKELPLCQQNEQIPMTIYNGNDRLSANANTYSRVLISKNILIPGDSTKQQEKIWLHNPHLASVKGLVLGHHGSHTSTGERLLQRLPHLQWAVASARQKKYGHPHKEVIQLLKRYRVPLLRTEDWGNLRFIIEQN